MLGASSSFKCVEAIAEWLKLVEKSERNWCARTQLTNATEAIVEKGAAGSSRPTAGRGRNANGHQCAIRLGFTRLDASAAATRGLECGRWWPFLFGLIDAALAAVIIAAVALTMMLGVQALDDLAAHGGGEDKRILPLVSFFDGIAKNPSAPEYWWPAAGSGKDNNSSHIGVLGGR